MNPKTTQATKPIPELNEKRKARFFSRIDQRGADECWPWKARTCGGYGVMDIRDASFFAHRIMFVLVNGEPPEDQPYILHRCDNRPCCNPKHLWPGTKTENNADREAKGRNNPPRGDAHYSRTEPHRLARGERNGLAKLTDEKIRKIRRLREEGFSQCRIASEVGVSQPMISQILLGRRWIHVK